PIWTHETSHRPISDSWPRPGRDTGRDQAGLSSAGQGLPPRPRRGPGVASVPGDPGRVRTTDAPPAEWPHIPAAPGGGGGGAARGGGGRARPKATIGSTSYDGTENEPFEPGWSGATWYGADSGTYWTINPKEYADPRKHGPEYLARARRNLRNEVGLNA